MRNITQTTLQHATTDNQPLSSGKSLSVLQTAKAQKHSWFLPDAKFFYCVRALSAPISVLMDSNTDSKHCNTMKLCNMSDTRNKILISLNILWTIKKKHHLLSLSFLFYERKLNTNLTFISGDFPFQGNYLITFTHTHTSSNVTVININKRNKTYCQRVLSKTLTPFYFRCFFLFRASLTKQHFISGLCLSSFIGEN